LLARFAGLDFDTVAVPPGDADSRKELLLLSPSILVPCLRHDGVTVWDTLAIGEYLHELFPRVALLPAERVARAHCRAVSGEMHSGFGSLRAALPMNLKGDSPDFRVWERAQADIHRICEIWRDCQARYGSAFLFGDRPGLADAMYAPVATRFLTYHVKLDAVCGAYAMRLLALPQMVEWKQAALAEPDEIEELDMEF
jgi:glutathione S-transferase